MNKFAIESDGSVSPMKKLVIESDGSVYGTTVTIDGEKAALTSIEFKADVNSGVRCDIGYDLTTQEPLYRSTKALEVDLKLTELDIFKSVVRALKEVYSTTNDTAIKNIIKHHTGKYFGLE